MSPERVLGAAASVAALLILGACASPASPDQMLIEAGHAASAGQAAKGYRALSVGVVNGGGKTNPLWMSDVSNDALKQALEASLRNLNYLADGQGAYVVTADIVDLDRPWAEKIHPILAIMPVDMSVSVRIRYVVRPAGGGQAVFDDVVGTTGTATAKDSVAPDIRLRKADEAAVRANIAEFVNRLQAAWR
jgi:hypothetical protein